LTWRRLLLRGHRSINVEPRQSGALSYLDIDIRALSALYWTDGGRILFVANIN
jgi:hypothetical protein